MDIVQIVLFALIVTILYLALKEIQPNIAFFILLFATIFIFLQLIQQLQVIIHFIQLLSNKTTIETFYLNTIFKIIGIAYITEIGANLTKDAGLSSLGAKIELAGKIFILLLAIPIIQGVIQMIIEFIPTSGSI